MTLLSFIDGLLPQDGKMRGVVLLVIGGLFGLVGPWCVTGVLASFQERVSFYNKVAEIESYRELPDMVKCSPQIAAAIAGINARVAIEHESNRHWYTDYFSTDRWNAVEVIPLRCGSTETGRREEY